MKASAEIAMRPPEQVMRLERLGAFHQTRLSFLRAMLRWAKRENWRFARPVFSADAVHWQRVARTNYVQETEQHGYFDFAVPIVGRHTYVAYSYPYSARDLARCLGACADRTDVDVRSLCSSAEGRPVPIVRVGKRSQPRHGVWVIARQHAGETPASYVAEGLLDWAAGDDR